MVNEFLRKHGLQDLNDYCVFHYVLGYYYLYSAKAFKLAECIEDGEVFDDLEVRVVMQQLYEVDRAYKLYREKVCPRVAFFNTAEKVTFQEGVLDCSKISGNKEAVLHTAKKWYSDFVLHIEDSIFRNYQEGHVDQLGNQSSRAFFLYQVSLYIFYLEDIRVDYSFLEKRSLYGVGKGRDS